MEIRTVWKNKMAFEGESHGHSILMDAKSPLGDGSGFTPKELVALGVAGCTAMDVVALLKKYKQTVESFEIKGDIQPTEGVHPAVFKSIHLSFYLTGLLDRDRVLESIKLSQTKFCGVSAMIVKTAPIQYKVFLNNEYIGEGSADFSGQEG